MITAQEAKSIRYDLNTVLNRLDKLIRKKAKKGLCNLNIPTGSSLNDQMTHVVVGKLKSLGFEVIKYESVNRVGYAYQVNWKGE